MDEQVTTYEAPPENLEHKPENGGVVVVDGQKYAVGLLWQPIQRSDDPLSEIRETVESEEGADLYCLRLGQYGIGKTSMGHRYGMPSLASTVASGLANYSSYCGVFQVQEGWWFVAVRNDLILSEEDVLYASEEEALRAFTSMMAVPDWELKIVPPSWNIEGAEHADLAELANRGHKDRLQEINAERKTKILLVFALIIIVAVIAVIFWAVQIWNRVWQQPTIQPEKEPEYIQPVQPTPEKAQPWEKLTDTRSFISVCWNNAYQLKSIVIPGWVMSTITCTPESIETSFSRKDSKSLLSWIRFALEEYQFTSLVVDLAQDGSSASATVSLGNIPKVASKPTWTAAQLEEDLSELVRATPALSGFNFSQQQELDPPNRPDGSRPANQKVYTYFQFSINSPYTPWEWLDFFDRFTGLVLLKMEYDPNDINVQWKYEGRIYAK